MPKPSRLTRTHRLTRLPRLTQLPLGVEIALILLVKIAILTVLAKAFFSEPQAKKMRMPTEQVEQHLLASPASAPASSSVFPSTTEVSHASH
ncbi:cytochrome oxidase putative small subunit CydP [Herbaspirillum sp. RV1423]|uniref:cytochrome oxidase putative small subunit CydP n=1 Tax=Herbaspirillum sp. RV1423 TaxID=1443993 RepID=UPI00054CFB65|nr:cytochrome oxidase putative small subunit CydP [Herbaspirillum sp. RV1423]